MHFRVKDLLASVMPKCSQGNPEPGRRALCQHPTELAGAGAPSTTALTPPGLSNYPGLISTDCRAHQGAEEGAPPTAQPGVWAGGVGAQRCWGFLSFTPSLTHQPRGLQSGPWRNTPGNLGLGKHTLIQHWGTERLVAEAMGRGGAKHVNSISGSATYTSCVASQAL